MDLLTRGGTGQIPLLRQVKPGHQAHGNGIYLDPMVEPALAVSPCISGRCRFEQHRLHKVGKHLILLLLGDCAACDGFVRDLYNQTS